MSKRKVIVVTDGDTFAQRVIEEAALNIGARCISKSGGNPTPRSGKEIVELVMQAQHDPVVVMVDDRGDTGTGAGEEAMNYILKNQDIEVMGVIAVASNTHHVTGIKVDCSIDRNGTITEYAVDKYGYAKDSKIVKGDTVDVLNSNDVPIVIGIGDPGKMDGYDSLEVGAPIITKAMKHIIEHKNGNVLLTRRREF